MHSVLYQLHLVLKKQWIHQKVFRRLYAGTNTHLNMTIYVAFLRLTVKSLSLNQCLIISVSIVNPYASILVKVLQNSSQSLIYNMI